jgi:hypothetical protein
LRGSNAGRRPRTGLLMTALRDRRLAINGRRSRCHQFRRRLSVTQWPAMLRPAPWPCLARRRRSWRRMQQT